MKTITLKNSLLALLITTSYSGGIFANEVEVPTDDVLPADPSEVMSAPTPPPEPPSPKASDLNPPPEPADASEVALAGLNHGVEMWYHDVKEIKNALATQAALTGLFQPYNVGQFNVTAAVGGYKDHTAIAVGAGYRFNKAFAVKAGIAKGSKKSNVAYNIGLNYEF
ncbi:YadA C-terminal domain-containing protein [Bisgaard Taxon 45]